MIVGGVSPDGRTESTWWEEFVMQVGLKLVVKEWKGDTDDESGESTGEDVVRGTGRGES